ncbi:DinB family protein [Seonamhaeicola marinus]|uniref:DinB family protein n=1 Tax=Seonamhaeicola marinus TaxID=1912246 RepID=A0A5D0JBT3_9FLAO|nr:DinB family protein [Seonamhaeicola marinus]TYA92338.1 DinB family protein [Seonamhaeicola marinus]
MNQPQQLSERLQEVLISGKWIAGTNIKEQVESITWQEATAKVSTLNTIATLLYHMNYYTEGVLHYFKTHKLEMADKYSFDAPEITNEQDWDDLKNKYYKASEAFIAYVKDMEALELSKPFFDEKYGDYQRNINVIIEHCYYHFGQIVLIKKLLRQDATK